MKGWSSHQNFYFYVYDYNEYNKLLAHVMNQILFHSYAPFIPLVSKFSSSNEIKVWLKLIDCF